MVTTYNLRSGNIDVLESDNAVTITLYSFEGELTIPNTCVYLVLVLNGHNAINSGIELNDHDKIDSILIKGDGSCDFSGPVGANSVEVRSKCNFFDNLHGNVIKLSGSEVRASYTDFGIECSGHIWILDSYLEISGYQSDIGIVSPFVLIDNSSIFIEANSEAIQTPHKLIISNCCTPTDYSDTEFKIQSLVHSDEEIGHELYRPDSFVYAVVENEQGEKEIVDRQKNFSEFSATLIEEDSYDWFKHLTQYTNVDLHRWIDQEGEIDQDGIYKGRGTNYIKDDTIDAITSDVWYETSPETEAISDEVIDEIIDGSYNYDGHPHPSEPITVDAVEAILNGTYDWSRYNQYELDELKHRGYELAIHGVNSYRTTEMTFYDESVEHQDYIDDLELP